MRTRHGVDGGGSRARGPAARLRPFERSAVAFLLRHLTVGLLGAAVFGTLILVADIGGIRTLAWASEHGWLFVVLLFFGLSITFGSVAMGISIMSLGRERD